MDNKKPNQINFKYNDKSYCLEYTRETVKQMEASGFKIGDIGDMPATRIEQLWAGAFLAHERMVSNTVIEKMYKEMKNKEKLLQKLTEMYNATLSYLMDDEGNVEWTATL